ncbi:MAG: hypothetical protein J4473_03920 [Candidatus Aenigmarchaeota archaeon]|nr:hypothetical protein [Candidatus Aenigmarchaeota archaeon]
MRLLKLFEDFVKEGVVKKVAPNKERAKSLISESERKRHSLNEQFKTYHQDITIAKIFIKSYKN